MSDAIEPAAPAGTEVAPGLRVPDDALRFKFVRSSGPGGQNVNKVSSACELRIELAALEARMTRASIERLRAALGSRLTMSGEVILVSDERRTQEQNRAAVLERLRDLIVRASIEPKRRKKTRPSQGSKLRRLESKKRRGQIKSGRGARFE
jgi:ribosome-associated protein